MTTKQKTRVAAFAFTVALLAAEAASAQTRGTLDPQPLPPLAKPDDPAAPAKELFGRKPMPAPLQARVIGFYSKGCPPANSANVFFPCDSDARMTLKAQGK